MDRIRLTDEELIKYAPDFWHMPQWRNYCIESSFSGRGEDCSLYLAKGNKLKAIVPLIRQGDTLSFQGSYCPKIIGEGSDILDKVSMEIVKYAKEIGVKHIMIDGYISGFLNYATELTVAYLDNIKIRKSYKSLINKANQLLTHNIIDNTTYDDAIIDNCMEFYNHVAGKVTRPPVTWQHYKDWIKSGHMSIFMAYDNDYLTGIVLITHYKEEAYYFMSAVNSDYLDFNVTHYLQNNVIKYLKDMDIKQYVLGSYERNSLLNCPSKKESDISFFKSGFGELRYKVVSEYFTDKNYMKEIFDKRLEQYYGAEYE